MKVKVKRVIKDSGVYRTVEVRTALMKDTSVADALEINRLYDLVPSADVPRGPSSGVVGPMSRVTVDQASLDELLDEIKRRARGSV